MFVDEISRVPKILIDEVISPLLKLNCVFIALSTNVGKQNFFSQWFLDKNPDWERYAIRMHINLMCEQCVANRRKPWECNHREHMQPGWHNPNNKRLVKLLMSGDGGDSEALYSREIMGGIMSDQDCVFDQGMLDAFRARVRWPIESIANLSEMTVLTFIDPTGGSPKATSECGIATVVRLNDGTSIILGLDSYNTQNLQQIRTLLTMYFGAMNQIPGLREAQHFVAIENNYGGSGYAELHLEAIKQAKPNIQEYKLHNDIHGVPTTPGNKKTGVYQMIWDMYLNRVHVAQPIITSDPKRADAHVNQFHEMCGNLRRVWQDGHHSYTAKRNGILPDDKLIAYIRANHILMQILAKGVVDHTEQRINEDIAHYALWQSVVSATDAERMSAPADKSQHHHHPSSTGSIHTPLNNVLYH